MKNSQGSKYKICPGSPDHAGILNSLPEEVSEVASSLLPEDLEILAYLIACPSQTRASTHHSGKSNKKVQWEVCCSKPPPSACRSVSSEDPCKSSSAANVEVQLRKPALFCCNCFQCYTSYWSRWDASPNRGKIDEAIALYEDHIDRKTKKSSRGSSESKSEKRHEGKGRGRKFHKEQKQKEVRALKEKEKKSSSSSSSTTASPTAVPPSDQVSELLSAAGKGVGGDQQERELLYRQNSAWAGDLDAVIPAGTSAGQLQEKASSSPKSPRNHVKNSQGKEKVVTKEVKLKTSRVAPFVGEGAMADHNDSSGMDSSDMDSEEDDSTTLHRGKKLMSFVASRLWGFWDRRAQTKVVDVY